MNNKWQEIENRIQLSKENIAESNITEAVVTFDLVSIEAEQAYNWVAREDEEYIIIDSATNETKTTSQNVTRVDFLRTAGFLTASKVAGDYTAEFNYALADGPVKTFKVTFTVV